MKHKKASLWKNTREGNGNPLQYSCLENPMDRGAWWAAVHGVARSWIRLSDFTFPFHFHALEKEMVTHSSVLAWGIPGTGEPRGLPSMGLHRVRHDWSDLAAAAVTSFALWIIDYICGTPQFENASTWIISVDPPSKRSCLDCQTSIPNPFHVCWKRGLRSLPRKFETLLKGKWGFFQVFYSKA